MQIGDSGPRAPVFTVVSRPNDWQKAVKTAGAGEAKTVSPLNATRQDFFIEALTLINAQRPSVSVPTRQRGNWISFAGGPFGYWSLSVTGENQIRLEAYIDLRVDVALNKALFDQFHDAKERWDSETGIRLSWERLSDKQASRIATYHPGELAEEEDWRIALDWVVRSFVAMYDALNIPLRTQAKALRQGFALQQDAEETAEHDAGGRLQDSEERTV